MRSTRGGIASVEWERQLGESADVEEGRGADYPCLPLSSLLSPSLIPFFTSSFFHYHRRVQLARKVSLEKTPESDTKTNLESREGATSTKSPHDQATLALTQSISKSVLVHSFSHLLPFSCFFPSSFPAHAILPLRNISSSSLPLQEPTDQCGGE